MKHYINLGYRHTIVTDCIPHEADPDDIYLALNRVEDAHIDVQFLAHDWQRQLRRELDKAKAPSMSTGSSVIYESDSGEILGGVVVVPVGFDLLGPNEARQFIQASGRTTHHHLTTPIS